MPIKLNSPPLKKIDSWKRILSIWGSVTFFRGYCHVDFGGRILHPVLGQYFHFYHDFQGKEHFPSWQDENLNALMCLSVYREHG